AAEATYSFNIPRKALGAALIDLAIQSGVSISTQRRRLRRRLLRLRRPSPPPKRSQVETLERRSRTPRPAFCVLGRPGVRWAGGIP
ncbi:hypothetical protein, partial [Phenylobacterium aquaticum]|uniref:hypothetical protein n=1 Tax=Phenylobacterium aquaticum TaxID=1763816 RepID=UPI001F5D7EFE